MISEVFFVLSHEEGLVGKGGSESYLGTSIKTPMERSIFEGIEESVQRVRL